MSRPFTPNGATVTLSVTNSTASSAIGSDTGTSTRTIRIAAPSSNAQIAFVAFGDSTITSTTARMPILPGTVETFYTGTMTHVAHITASGTATLYVTPGEGE